MCKLAVPGWEIVSSDREISDLQTRANQTGANERQIDELTTLLPTANKRELIALKFDSEEKSRDR